MTRHRNLRRHADPAVLSRGPFRTDVPACYACGHDDQPGFVGFADVDATGTRYFADEQMPSRQAVSP